MRFVESKLAVGTRLVISHALKSVASLLVRRCAACCWELALSSGPYRQARQSRCWPWYCSPGYEPERSPRPSQLPIADG